MPENLPSVLPQLCCSALALFFAVVVVPFLALLFRSARKRQQLRTTLANIPLRSVAALQLGQGLVRLRGTVSQVPNPVAPFSDVAILRVTVDIQERGDEETRYLDRVEVRPFLLDDGSDTVWVDPTGLDRFLIGEGVVPVEQERLDALRAVGLPTDLAGGNIQAWAISVGQEVNVVGTVQEKDGQTVIGKARGRPLVVSPSDLAELTVQAGRQSATAWAVWALLGAIGLCMLAVFFVALASALRVLLGAG